MENINLDNKNLSKCLDEGKVDTVEPLLNETTIPISKSKMKKMRKQQEWENKKQKIKKLKKEAQKQKKKFLKESNKNQEETIKIMNANVLTRKEREELYLNKVKQGISVIIDCDFENLMNDKDIGSLVRQITYCYSVNKKVENPFNFILYDVDEKINSELNKNNFVNWLGVKLIKKSEYSSICEFLTCNKDNIVYLTADSENEITELNPNENYLIGGIVDRNRYKLITLERAIKLGIKHARLPIGDYIHLNSSKVLTTNHVFSILSYYVNIKNDWKDAFMSIIPKRKMD